MPQYQPQTSMGRRLEKMLGSLEKKFGGSGGKVRRTQAPPQRDRDDHRDETHDEIPAPDDLGENDASYYNNDTDGQGSFLFSQADTVGQEDFPTTRPTEAPPTIIPEVRGCGWKDFVNRFSEEGSSSSYAIEVLVAGSQIGRDIVAECEIRQRMGVAGANYMEDYKPPAFRSRRSHRDWIQRIRINSPSLLKIFADVTNYGWGTKPHTFIRPFRYLIHFHGRLKQALQDMEADYYDHNSIPAEYGPSKEWAPGAFGGSASNLSSHGQNSTASQAEDMAGLKDLRIYIDFADTHLMHAYNSFNHASFSNPRSIRFDDLWYLFRPGDLIYVCPTSLKRSIERYVTSQDHAIQDSQPHTFGARDFPTMHQKVWRLYFASPPESDPDAPLSVEENDWNEYSNRKRTHFSLACYYLDFDGVSYAATQPFEFIIDYFEGEKDIRSLECFPLRFHSDPESFLYECKASGRRYTECVKQKHMSYAGWTVNTSPLGLLMPDPYNLGYNMARPERIESEVIIDFRETFNAVASWKGVFADDETWEGRARYDSTIESPDPIIIWSDARRTRKLSVIEELIVSDDDIDSLEHDVAFTNDRYLNPKTRSEEPPTGDDLALLPGRLFAYALLERKFVQLSVHHLREIPYQADVFDKLELLGSHKEIINALVSSHLDMKRLGIHGNIGTQDLIYRKGRGLVLLLHGEPGVGKTATAEAIAHKYGRPLFSITCGDLGVEPTMVEHRLNEIFRLAHLWDCILLLDEADIFLTARSATDLKRNGIVTVFLRIMEYYDGILLLTTNRIGKLDPAITSRVHVSLHYKRLGEAEVRNIFLLNIERLHQIECERQAISNGESRLQIAEGEILDFATEHYSRHAKSAETSFWNGRQIRNAFTVATALARRQASVEASRGSRGPAQLRAWHFREVEKLTSDFDRFRSNLMGGDDAYLARKKEERDDDWGQEETEIDALPSVARGSARQSRLSMMLGGYSGGEQMPQTNTLFTTPPPPPKQPPFRPGPHVLRQRSSTHSRNTLPSSYFPSPVDSGYEGGSNDAGSPIDQYKSMSAAAVPLLSHEDDVTSKTRRAVLESGSRRPGSDPFLDHRGLRAATSESISAAVRTPTDTFRHERSASGTTLATGQSSSPRAQMW